MRDYFHGMGVRELHDGLTAGEFTARELAEATLERIERVDEDVHAFLEVTRARRRSRRPMRRMPGSRRAVSTALRRSPASPSASATT